MESGHICPWWMGYLLASPIRRWLENPYTLLKPHVHLGMTVFEPGPGMGFFTLDLARLVGDKGKVIAVDIQPKMLTALARRARRAGLQNRIILREPVGTRMGLDDLVGQVDFVLAFAMVHELPDAAAFFQEVSSVLKAKGKLLLAEPKGHVDMESWNKTLQLAHNAGLRKDADLHVRRSHAALLMKA
jgi:ubiquinone/menaquinone biosynthesis C-methylase UbiE